MISTSINQNILYKILLNTRRIIKLKEHKDTYEKMVCGSPFHDAPKKLNAAIDCPDYCKIQELNTKQFHINSTGHLSINATHHYSNVRINKLYLNIMETKKIYRSIMNYRPLIIQLISAYKCNRLLCHLCVSSGQFEMGSKSRRLSLL